MRLCTGAARPDGRLSRCRMSRRRSSRSGREIVLDAKTESMIAKITDQMRQVIAG